MQVRKEATATACVELPSPKGFIDSPASLTAGEYPEDTHACWTVHATNASLIVRFRVKYFDVEPHFDTLQLHNDDESASSISSISGKVSDDVFFYSSHSRVNIDFHSDDSENSGGFRLFYEELPASYIPQPPASPSAELIPVSSMPYTLTSANYPASYPLGVDTLWLFDSGAASGRVVRLRLNALLTEEFYDSVFVYDGDSTVKCPLLVQLTGNLTDAATVPVFYSSARYMLVHFHSDATGAARGFSMAVDAVVDAEACRGGQVVRVEETVTVLEPPVYAAGTTYTWHLKTAVGRQVQCEVAASTGAVTVLFRDETGVVDLMGSEAEAVSSSSTASLEVQTGSLTDPDESDVRIECWLAGGGDNDVTTTVAAENAAHELQSSVLVSLLSFLVCARWFGVL